MTDRLLPDSPWASPPRLRRAPVPPALVGGIGAFALLTGLAAATQVAAYRFGYHPHLGAPLRPAPPLVVALTTAVLLVGLAVVVLIAQRGRPLVPLLVLAGVGAALSASGPIYPPMRVVQWALAYGRAGEAVWVPIRATFQEAAGIGLAATLATALAMGLVVVGARSPRVSTTHGSAAWGRGDELRLPRAEGRRRARLLRAGVRVAEPELSLGRHADGSRLAYRGESHVLTIAPTRSGKGVGAVVPTLLTYPGSVVCLDIKGENFHVTHRARLELGGQVYVLDPFRVTGEHSYHAHANPLDAVHAAGPEGDRALDDCKALAEMLVPEGGKENRHFTDEGRSLLACLMLHVCHEHQRRARELRTLLRVRELITLPEESFAHLLETMADSGHPMVRRGAARLTQKEERERSGVISTAQAGIDFLDSGAMARVLAVPADREGVRRLDLARIVGETPLTVYVVLPPEALRTHSAWVRLLLAGITQHVVRERVRATHRVLLLLDEFAQLGHVRPVLEGISLVGGYGVRYWLVVQDLAQLRGIYREQTDTLFANCDVKQCFGTADWGTAELLSKMTGEATVVTEGMSTGTGRSWGRSGGRSANWGTSASEKGRRLLLPDEVMRLARDRALLFVRGSPPIVARRLDYLRDPEYAGRFDPNPLHG